jgi:hypothetical protein
MKRFSGREVPCPRTYVNAVQHLSDYGTFGLINRDRGRSRSRRVLDLQPEILQLLRKNRVADDLHYEWAFPVSQFGEQGSSSTCPTLETRRSTTSNCILSMASSKNRRTQFFKYPLNHRPNPRTRFPTKICN